MENIIDYVREWGKWSLLEKPLNEVDSLVLCQMSYMNYGRFVPGIEEENAPVSIQSLYHDPAREHLLDDYWYRENNWELFTAAAQSVRFGSLKLNYYMNVIDLENEAQFAALTYVLEDKSIYLAYRGTDATIVGWKEDLNLAFSKPLPSQHLALEYMEKIADRIGGSIYAGGHSKGGNLVTYAAMNCRPEIRSKLLAVYNHDGPGFRPEIRAQGCYEEIVPKLRKFIPRSSLVGVLLEDQSDYEVVESKGIGMLQHNPYSWKIEGDHFIRAREMTAVKQIRDAALNQWILSLTEDEIHAFVDTLYEVISASQASDVFEFGADWKKSLSGVLEAARGIDDDTRKAIHKIVRSLFEITGQRAVLELAEKQEHGKNRVFPK